MSTLRRLLILVSAIVIGCGGATATTQADIDAAAAKAKAEAEAKEAARPKLATAVLHTAPDSVVTGIVSFTRDGEILEVDAEFQGLEPGVHHFYIHEVGDCDHPELETAGAPFKIGNGFGNIEANEKGAARVEFTSEAISLEGPDTIIGRSVIIHSGPEQPSEDNPSLPLACGVIKRQ